MSDAVAAEPPHKRPSWVVTSHPVEGFYILSHGKRDEGVCFFLLFFWCLAANLISPNSRFGGFNSRLGRFEFPIRSATGIGRQRLDLACRFRGRMALKWGKSKKFPAQREKSGMVIAAPGGTTCVCHPCGQSRRIGSPPSQSMAASRTASKMRRRVGVSSAISMTVPGWPSLRK